MLNSGAILTTDGGNTQCKTGDQRASGSTAQDLHGTEEGRTTTGEARSPDYQQMSVYIHRDVRTKVKMRLFEKGGEFSALVESLLRDWLTRG